MSRPALSLAILVLALIATCGQLRAAGDAINPHVDSSLNPGGCASCHAGHGASQSPMLPEAQGDVCTRCHGTRSQANAEILAGRLSAGAEPALLSEVLAMPYAHRISQTAYSRLDQGETTCTSCHSPHRSMPGDRDTDGPTGIRKLSPRNPERFEHELCQECHGSAGATTRDLRDISRLFDLSNRSYHPVQASALERSPSVVEALSGREINCTDCHGNDDPSGPRGPHGSGLRYMLRQAYTTVDGDEGESAYRLCYSCHPRDRVLDESSPFPLHEMHVVDEGASCATCHSAHGSVGNRALIRFGEETTIGGVSPSVSTGTLEFVSDAQGSGACSLTCHGIDHGPEAYGFMKNRLDWRGKDLSILPSDAAVGAGRPTVPR